jgi:hypothetical protein
MAESIVEVAMAAGVVGALIPVNSAETGALAARAVEPRKEEAAKPTTGMRGAPARTRSTLRREALAKVVI